MSRSQDTALELAFYFGCFALLVLASAFHWHKLFWAFLGCFAVLGWIIEQRRISRAEPVNWSQRTMVGAAMVFGFYAIAMLTLGDHTRDGFWALVVCFALIWGAIEHRRNERRTVKPDLRSQLRLK